MSRSRRGLGLLLINISESRMIVSFSTSFCTLTTLPVGYRFQASGHKFLSATLGKTPWSAVREVVVGKLIFELERFCYTRYGKCDTYARVAGYNYNAVARSNINII